MDEKPKFDTGHFLSMEKYLQLTMEPIRGRLEDVNSSLEKLSISITEYEHMKYQVATHSEAVREFEKAIVELEKGVHPRKLPQNRVVDRWDCDHHRDRSGQPLY